MSQASLSISNGAGAAVRAAINDAFTALATLNSGATAPATTYQFLWWADTGTGLLKQRNAANSAWVIMGTLGTAYFGIPASGISYAPGSPAAVDAENVQDAIDALAVTVSGLGNGWTNYGSQSVGTGTAVDFSDLPAGIDQIIIEFDGVSADGLGNILVQLGAVGGLETTGYVSTSLRASNGASPAVQGYTAGFQVRIEDAAEACSGHLHLTRMSGNKWIASGQFVASTTKSLAVAGSKTLSGELDRIRLTLHTGNFDGGNVNLKYLKAT